MSSFIQIFALIPLLLCACINTVHSEKSTNLFMSIEELYRACMPGDCGKEVKLEGKEVHVRGLVDRENVFDKKSYPRLPYEKFKIFDKLSGKSIEVWAVSNDNSRIFKKIGQSMSHPDKEVFISGFISSFDMPTMRKCKRGIKIEIKSADNIFFK